MKKMIKKFVDEPNIRTIIEMHRMHKVAEEYMVNKIQEMIRDILNQRTIECNKNKVDYLR